ncbi:MAG: 4-hydroxybenzoyl-CoA reductase subunit beta [Acidobacteriota bacterium]|nr:4-hydroxybenzoyl-CoA reductase subunit beta [Acidobacteriota bacterium]
MSTLPDFQLLRPATASDAVRLRALHPGGRYLAGGTDLLPNLRRGLVATEAVIDLSSVDELTDLREEAGVLVIGAGVTLATLSAYPAVRDRLPALAQAASGVAGPTHRVSATLGGNLCQETRCRFYNQSESWREANDYCLKLGSDTCRVAAKSPRCYAAFSGDIAPALMVLGAVVEILGPVGTRILPIAEFYRDDGVAWLALAPAELLVAVRVPLKTGWASAYEKVRVRGSMDFPLAGVAVALRREGDALADLRIALTGVSSRPEFISGLEALAGHPLDETAMAIIARQIKLGIKAMDTTLVEAPFRRRITPVLAKRLVERLWTMASH